MNRRRAQKPAPQGRRRLSAAAILSRLLLLLLPERLGPLPPPPLHLLQLRASSRRWSSSSMGHPPWKAMPIIRKRSRIGWQRGKGLDPLAQWGAVDRWEVLIPHRMETNPMASVLRMLPTGTGRAGPVIATGTSIATGALPTQAEATVTTAPLPTRDQIMASSTRRKMMWITSSWRRHWCERMVRLLPFTAAVVGLSFDGEL
mmetsp:Transcript_3586/g.8806  ORF Transcript_3586/g.8806 Transcript_3586/m.8806 type:complete len:202 (-) Transcript_3586:94-699(-)